MSTEEQYGEVWSEGLLSRAVYRVNSRSSMVELLACAAHMANRAYCLALGDTSQPTWSEAPEWQQASAISGVRAALNPNQTPEKSHEDWYVQKHLDGWTWGPVKDPVLKLHPCMLMYNQLPEVQRFKDILFLTTVRELGKALGVYCDEEVGD